MKNKYSAMDKGSSFTNKCLKVTFILFLCIIVCDLIYMHLRPNYATESRLYSRHNSNDKSWSTNNRGRNLNSERRASDGIANCVGYGKSVNNKQTCKKRLPNCLIIGIAKAGTYSLLKFLSAHPQVVRNEKINEYDFFSDQYKNGINWYKDRMPFSLPGQVVLEKSPSYFPHPEAPERVFRMDPNIRLILIVRHPVYRSISSYAMNKEKVDKGKKSVHPKNQSNDEPQILGAFETRWRQYVQFYDNFFENWLNYFNLSQVHIVDGDKLVKDPIREMEKVEEFLNIDSYFNNDVFIFNATKGFYCLRTGDKKDKSMEPEMDCMYEGKGREHPDVSEEVMKQMQKLYRPHNQRFYKLSGRHFDWDTL